MRSTFKINNIWYFVLSSVFVQTHARKLQESLVSSFHTSVKISRPWRIQTIGCTAALSRPLAGLLSKHSQGQPKVVRFSWLPSSDISLWRHPREVLITAPLIGITCSLLPHVVISFWLNHWNRVVVRLGLNQILCQDHIEQWCWILSFIS